MSFAALHALLSHWWRNPLQLFTLLAGLSLATALWSGVQAINAEARASYDAAAQTLGEGQFTQIVSRNGTFPQADYIALRRAGWLVSPIVDGRLGGVRLVGLDALTAPRGLWPLSGPNRRYSGARYFCPAPLCSAPKKHWRASMRPQRRS